MNNFKYSSQLIFRFKMILKKNNWIDKVIINLILQNAKKYKSLKNINQTAYIKL